MKRIFLIGLLLLSGGLWAANPGDLDTSFGGIGYVVERTVASGDIYDGAHSIVQQADGKVVVAGATQGYGSGASDLAVVRYLSSGTLDTTFGYNDRPGITRINVGESWSIANQVVIQPDSKILVVGTCEDDTYPLYRKICLVRLETDGRLDSSFGGGEAGYRTVLLEGGSCEGLGVVYQVVDGLNDKIWVSGYITYGDYSCLALLRFNTDGSLDTTLNPAHGTVLQPGIVYVSVADPLNRNCRAESIVLDTDGYVILGGCVDSVGATPGYAVVLRYTTDGELDTTFNGTGIKNVVPVAEKTAFGRTVMVQADGKIVITGSIRNDWYVGNLFAARLGADGQLDTTFGTGGIVMYPTAGTLSVTSFERNGVSALQPAGQLLLGGYASSEQDPSSTSTLLLRYTSAGILDLTFGTGGVVTTSDATDNVGITGILGTGAGEKIFCCGGATDKSDPWAGTVDLLTLSYLDPAPADEPSAPPADLGQEDSGSSLASATPIAVQVITAKKMVGQLGLRKSDADLSAKFCALLRRKSRDF